MDRRIWFSATLVLVAAGVLLALVAPPAAGQSGAAIAFNASIDGRALDGSSVDDPIPLRAEDQITIRVAIENREEADLLVRGIRLDGQVLALTFFSYEARLDAVIPAGATETREFPVDLIDLGGQADGLIPSRLALLDADRQVLGSVAFPTDVRGSLLSVYGLFSLVVAAITIVLLTSAVIRLGTGRLSTDRWRQGARFGIPGLGVGLSAAFVLSSLRVTNPTPDTCTRFVVVGGAALFIAGYLAPPRPGPVSGPPRRVAPASTTVVTGARRWFDAAVARLRTRRPKSSKNQDSPLRKAVSLRTPP